MIESSRKAPDPLESTDVQVDVGAEGGEQGTFVYVMRAAVTQDEIHVRKVATGLVEHHRVRRGERQRRCGRPDVNEDGHPMCAAQFVEGIYHRVRWMESAWRIELQALVTPLLQGAL